MTARIANGVRKPGFSIGAIAWLALCAVFVSLVPCVVYGDDEQPKASIRKPKEGAKIDDAVATDFVGWTRDIADGVVPIGFVLADEDYQKGNRDGYPLFSNLEPNKRIDTRLKVSHMKPGTYWIVLWVVPEQVADEILKWKEDREAFNKKFGSTDGHAYSFLKSVRSQGQVFFEQSFERLAPD